MSYYKNYIRGLVSRKDALYFLRADYVFAMIKAQNIYNECGECDEYDNVLAHAADLAMECEKFGTKIEYLCHA